MAFDLRYRFGLIPEHSGCLEPRKQKCLKTATKRHIDLPPEVCAFQRFMMGRGEGDNT